MFVSRSMNRKVITIDENADILEAKAKMAEHRIRHLPVVTKDNRLCGMVSDRDIRSAMPSGVLDDPDSEKTRSRLAEIKVAQIMTKDLVTLSPQYTLPDALLLVQGKKVGASATALPDGRAVQEPFKRTFLWNKEENHLLQAHHR